MSGEREERGGTREAGRMAVCACVEGQLEDTGVAQGAVFVRGLHEAGSHNEGQGHGNGLP